MNRLFTLFCGSPYRILAPSLGRLVSLPLDGSLFRWTRIWRLGIGIRPGKRVKVHRCESGRPSTAIGDRELLVFSARF